MPVSGSNDYDYGWKKYYGKKNCCYQCSRRKVGCHSECQEYKDFKRDVQIRNSMKARKQGGMY